MNQLCKDVLLVCNLTAFILQLYTIKIEGRNKINYDQSHIWDSYFDFDLN